MKRMLLLSLFVSLAIAPPAVAKSLKAVEVCGESECVSVPRSELRGHEGFGWVFGGANNVGAEPLPAGADRFRVRVTMGAGTDGHASHVIREAVAPDIGYVRTDVFTAPGEVEGWERMTLDAQHEWERLTKGMAPLPTPQRPVAIEAFPDPWMLFSMIATLAEA